MKKILIINALVWAVVILTAAYLFKEVPQMKLFLIVLISASSIIHLAMTFYLKNKKLYMINL